MSEENPGRLNSAARGCGNLIQGILITIGAVFVIVGLCGGAAFSALSIGVIGGLLSLQSLVDIEGPATQPPMEVPTAVFVVPPTPAVPSPAAPETQPPAAVAFPELVTPPASLPPPTAIPAPPVGLTFDEICGVSGSDMTDPQLEAHVANYVGRPVENWQGWVNDVTRYGDTYHLLISMEPRDFLWARDIVVEGIPQDIAFQLSIEDPITFSGHIARIETTLDVACNPLYLDQFVLKQ